MGKNIFFDFALFLLKIYFFQVLPFFSCLLRVYPANFSVVVHIYKICVFDEVFFLLTTRMTMITKLFWVVACCKELLPIYMHDMEQSRLVGSRDK